MCSEFLSLKPCFAWCYGVTVFGDFTVSFILHHGFHDMHCSFIFFFSRFSYMANCLNVTIVILCSCCESFI